MREVLHGVRCFLTAPLAGRGRQGAGRAFTRRARKDADAHHGTRPSELAPDLRRRFPVHLLPPDLITFAVIFAASDDWMVVGEYGNNFVDKAARVFYLNRHSCKMVPYYSNFNGVRHIHSVHKLSDTQVAIATGDRAKLFDIWDVNESGMEFSKRVLRHNGGFTSGAKVGGDNYFGTDFSRRPNYIFRLRDGKRWFFPEPAFTKYTIGLDAVDNRYLVSLNRDLVAFGGEMAWTVFDTRREEFVHAAPARRKAAKPLPQPSARPDLRQPRHRPLVLGLPFPQPLAGAAQVCVP